MTTILIIEDIKPLREQIARCLTLEGFDVLAAPDGSSGLDMALTHEPNLVISDIRLPGIDGYQVLTEIQQRPDRAAIPFIFMSAKTDRTDIRHGMELGADDYLTKPFTNEELLRAIHTRLRKQDNVVRAVSQEYEFLKTHLAETFSQQLHGPLKSIMSVQRRLSEQWNDLSLSEIRTLLNTLQEGSHRLHHLVEQSDFLTQMESGTLNTQTVQEQYTPIEVLPLLTSAVNLARQYSVRYSTKRVSLQVIDHHLVVMGHLQSLTHALAEPITSAMDNASARSELIVSQWEKEDTVWIRIYDPEWHLTTEELTAVMVNFDAGDEGQRHHDRPSVDLSLARQIVEAHNGQLDVSSRAGKGTQVLIQLPVAHS